MSLSALAGALWVIAAALTALLPMRAQAIPGLPLLVLAPFFIAWLAWDHGWLIGLFALFAFLSMFRRPLAYLLRRLSGQAAAEARR